RGVLGAEVFVDDDDGKAEAEHGGRPAWRDGRGGGGQRSAKGRAERLPREVGPPRPAQTHRISNMMRPPPRPGACRDVKATTRAGAWATIAGFTQEGWMSGLSRTPGKRVWANNPPRVRIPPPPPPGQKAA